MVGTRSMNYFQAICRGLWIVSWGWAEACIAAGSWLPEAPFEVKRDGFHEDGPAKGRLRAAAGGVPLFSGRQFYFSPRTDLSGTTLAHFVDLISDAGGTILANCPPPPVFGRPCRTILLFLCLSRPIFLVSIFTL